VGGAQHRYNTRNSGANQDMLNHAIDKRTNESSVLGRKKGNRWPKQSLCAAALTGGRLAAKASRGGHKREGRKREPG